MTTLSGAAQPASCGGLARHLRGRVTGPDSPDWDTARRPWNHRVDRQRLADVKHRYDPANVICTSFPVTAS